jgi:hypothetical protein
MTIVFTLLQMQTQSCPRPGCGSSVSGDPQSNGFRHCPVCQLTFRFDPNLTALGLLTDEEKLKVAQQSQDRDSYGRRQQPLDLVDERSDVVRDLRQNNTSGTAEQAHRDEEQKAVDLCRYDEEDEPMNDAPDHDSDSEQPEKDLFGYDSGSIATWLEHSVIATTPGGIRQEPADLGTQSYVSRQQEEFEALKTLNRIHFTQKVPETKPLRDTVKTYSKLPLEEQIYFRKIVDRFPTLPPYLAKRFASANVGRAERLRAQKTNLEPSG